MAALKRVAGVVLVVASVLAAVSLLTTCSGEPVAGEPCARPDLLHTVTLTDGDVLECRPVWGSADRQVWMLVGHNQSSEGLMWLGRVAAVFGITALAVGLVGIITARYGRRR